MAGGRYRSKADLRQEGLAIRNINMRNSLVRVRIALGLGERTSINDLVQASEKLLSLRSTLGLGEGANINAIVEAVEKLVKGGGEEGED